MTTADMPTLDQVLTLAHKLPRHDRAELIARLVRELAITSPTPLAEHNDSLGDLEQLIGAAAEAGPARIDSADVLAAIRR